MVAGEDDHQSLRVREIGERPVLAVHARQLEIRRGGSGCEGFHLRRFGEKRAGGGERDEQEGEDFHSAETDAEPGAKSIAWALHGYGVCASPSVMVSPSVRPWPSMIAFCTTPRTGRSRFFVTPVSAAAGPGRKRATKRAVTGVPRMLIT